MAWPHRDPGSHKGTHGHLLIVAGSVGMSGAAILAARAALRSGAGLVTLAVPEPIRAECAGAVPEAMVKPCAATADGALAPEAAAPLLATQQSYDALAIGPGMGQEPATQQAVRDLLRGWNRAAVIDADAINAFAQQGVRGIVNTRHAVTSVLTPHPGEFARLTGTTAAAVQADRRGALDRFFAAAGAEPGRIVVVLKGSETLTANNARVIANSTGNAGLARGGTGDVLTGLIGGMLASIRDAGPLAIAATAVAWHGAAGDHAARQFSQTCMTTGDVINALPPTLPNGLMGRG